MSYVRDICDYVHMVVQDNFYRYPRFIPVALPRRFGKTTIAEHLEGFHDLEVVDKLDYVDRDIFFSNILPVFRHKKCVLVGLFTPQHESHYTSKFITDSWPSFHGKYNTKDNLLDLKFPDGTMKRYKVPHINEAKEAELNSIIHALYAT